MLYYYNSIALVRGNVLLILVLSADIPVIPDLDEVVEEDFTQQVAKAPRSDLMTNTLHSANWNIFHVLHIYSQGLNTLSRFCIRIITIRSLLYLKQAKEW